MKDILCVFEDLKINKLDDEWTRKYSTTWSYQSNISKYIPLSKQNAKWQNECNSFAKQKQKNRYRIYSNRIIK